MRLGTGARVIDVPLGTSMAGFGFRDHGAESVLDDLEVRAFWLADDEDGDFACIVCADIISFDAQMTQRFRQELYDRFGVPTERLLLAASHTHGGPVVSEVSEQVFTAVVNAVEEARSRLRSVSMHLGRGRCSGYAINRRKIADGVSHHGPNPSGVRDDDVSVVAFRDAESGQSQAVLYHFTCHPTTMGDYRITGDYPGVTRRFVEKALGEGAAVGFLPGCFGDIRPNCTFIGGETWRRGQPEDIDSFGVALGNEVLDILENRLHPLNPCIAGFALPLDLPFERCPTRGELESVAANGTDQERRWAAKLLQEESPLSASMPLALQRLDLASELSLVAMGGEMVCDYGLWIKQQGEGRHILPMGYSNGMVGYVASKRQFPEGGYEVDYYLQARRPMSSRFDSQVERLIQAGVQRLLSQ